MSVLAWSVLAVAAVAALGWLALTVRLALLLRRERALRPFEGPVPGDAPAIDVLVAARDEQREIEASVRSILAQDYPGFRLTVVDDQSTDATGAILDRLASEAPIRVVRGVDRPEGWVGKTWALHQGLEGTHADWLLFVDADMRLHPRAVTTAWKAGREAGADLVSIFPGAECRTFWQRAIAVMLGELLAHLYPASRVNDPSSPDALAAGGFLLVRRTVYERAGGHEAVRREIVEDIQLARRIKAVGGRLLVKGAPALATTHMYGTLGEIWRGLRKNAYAGMEYQFHKYVTGAIVALTMAWAPVVAAAWGLVAGVRGEGWANPLLVVGLAGWLAQGISAAPLAWFLRIPLIYALSLPAGITLYVAIATSSVWHHRRGRILWKGRVYEPSTVVAADPGVQARLAPLGGRRDDPAEPSARVLPGPGAGPGAAPGGDRP